MPSLKAYYNVCKRPMGHVAAGYFEYSTSPWGEKYPAYFASRPVTLRSPDPGDAFAHGHYDEVGFYRDGRRYELVEAVELHLVERLEGHGA